MGITYHVFQDGTIEMISTDRDDMYTHDEVIDYTESDD